MFYNYRNMKGRGSRPGGSLYRGLSRDLVRRHHEDDGANETEIHA